MIKAHTLYRMAELAGMPLADHSNVALLTACAKLIRAPAEQCAQLADEAAGVPAGSRTEVSSGAQAIRRFYLADECGLGVPDELLQPTKQEPVAFTAAVYEVHLIPSAGHLPTVLLTTADGLFTLDLVTDTLQPVKVQR
jgi:hypothetical protein